VVINQRFVLLLVDVLLLVEKILYMPAVMLLADV